MPVTLHHAFTASIPSTLTQDQVWRGLVYKCAHPESMIPAKSCKVLHEDDNGMKRHVVFNDGKEVDEEIIYHKPAVVIFKADNGSVVQNIISGFEGQQLYLTFTFAWVHADLDKSSNSAEEIEARRQQMHKMSEGAVNKTLQVIEQKVKAGEL